MDERRRFPRLNFSVEVEYKLLNSSPDFLKVGKSKNLSGGGICIVALEKLNIGDTLSLKFSLPGDEKGVTAQGRVAWIDEFAVGNIGTSQAYDAGIEFTSIHKDDRKNIEQYLMQHL